MRGRRWANVVVRAAARDAELLTDATLMLFGDQPMHLSTGLRIVRAGLVDHGRQVRWRTRASSAADR
jgi:hypothetical protein